MICNFSLYLSLPEPLNITQGIQDHEVTVGDSANFTCSAMPRGTNTTIRWEIGGTEYRGCSQEFCVSNTNEDGSISSTLVINTKNMTAGDQDVRCIVEQMYRGQVSISRALLTVREAPTTGKCVQTHSINSLPTTDFGGQYFSL